MKVTVQTRTAASVLEDPDACSLKRAAWAYGCAKKDSDEERALLAVLLSKTRSTDPEKPPTQPAIWTFRKTGRKARVIAMESTADRDTVVFRFLDADASAYTRKSLARKFLSDFEVTT